MFVDGIFSGTKDSSEEFIVGTPVVFVICRTVKDGLVRTLQIQSPTTASVEELPGDEPREPREPREQPLRIDVRPVHADLPLPISREPAKSRRVYIRNSFELARYGYTPGCIGCEAAVTQGPARDHSEQCWTRIIQAMSSDVALSVYESGKRTKECHVQPLMQSQT